jgi:amino acid adenylation domain-containing protein
MTVDPARVATTRMRKSEPVSTPTPAGSAVASTVVPDPAHRHDPFPLSDLQRAYIFGRNSALALGGIGCDVCVEFDQPQLDPKRLETVWNKLIARHEILRIAIIDDEHQRILPEVPWFKIPVIDLASAAADEVDAALAVVREEMRERIHDVRTWPLYDVRAALLPAGISRIFVKVDLIGTDAASAYRILRELAAALEDSERRDFSPPLVSYRDYRLAEERRCGGAIWERDRQFWQDVVPTLPLAPQLPYIASFEALTPPRFQRMVRRLDTAATRRLEAAAAEHDLSLATVVNAAFAEVVAQWSTQRHFLLNIPTFLPPDDSFFLDPTTGNYTSNVLVAADMRSGDFLARARALAQVFALALQHRSYSGVRVLRDLQKLHGTSLQPIAPVVLTNLVAHRRIQQRRQHGFAEPACGLSRTPQVVLDHQILIHDDDLTFYWDNVVGAFAPGVIDAMASAQVQLLMKLASDEEAWRDPHLSLLGSKPAALRARVNNTACDVPLRLLHEGFFAAAAKHPEAPALIDGERTVRYSELAARAASVFRILTEAGTAPGDTVAGVLPHGLDLAAVGLGCLACSAVYAPLNPASPVERRHRELQLLKPRVLFTDQPTADSSSNYDCLVILTSEIAPSEVDAISPVPRLGAASSDLDARAYVMFTSGTTGEPKAIAITHRGAANTCGDVAQRFTISRNDRVLGLSAPTFDLSIFDMFGVWSVGGCLVLPAQNRRSDPEAWAQAIETHRVTLWNTVPALMAMLVAHCEGRQICFDHLRLVMLSGDWISPALVPRITRLAPRAEIISLGGATEASIWSIIHPIKPEDARLASIPYGVPMRNQTIHVLDEVLLPRPDHVEGDIYIGGMGLAECYVGDPHKTASAFIIHPKTRERLYRTGDRGRYESDGEVEFLGRRDTQLKVQGYRIEAGEVEHALGEVNGVAQVVVDSVGERFDSKRVVAFVVPALGAEPPDVDPNVTKQRLAVQEERRAFKAERRGLRTIDPSARRVTFGEVPVERWTKRRSARRFATQPTPFDDLAFILSHLRYAETDSGRKYVYPSAGGLYPVQTYLYVEPDRVARLEVGLYYVDPGGSLVVLSTERIATQNLHAPHNRKLAGEAAFTLMMFGHLPAIAPQYGPLARDFCLLEAGYAAQTLMEAAAQTGCELCPIGAMVVEPFVAKASLQSQDVFLNALVGGARSQLPNEPEAEDVPIAHASPSGPNLTERLRAQAAKRLPAYMYPHDIVILERLPLAANGKVDRSALRNLATSQLHDPLEAEGPSTDAEGCLTEIATRVLGLSTVDINREFFALGGDSVKLVEMSAAIEREFNRRVELVDVFQYPTIRKMAAFLSTTSAPSTEDAVVRKARQRSQGRARARQRNKDGEPDDG